MYLDLRIDKNTHTRAHTRVYMHYVDVRDIDEENPAAERPKKLHTTGRTESKHASRRKKCMNTHARTRDANSTRCDSMRLDAMHLTMPRRRRRRQRWRLATQTAAHRTRIETVGLERQNCWQTCRWRQSPRMAYGRRTVATSVAAQLFRHKQTLTITSGYDVCALRSIAVRLLVTYDLAEANVHCRMSATCSVRNIVNG